MYWDDDYAASEYGEPSWDLWKQLDECQDLWFDTYRRYWGLGADECPEQLSEREWDAAKIRDGLAAATFEMAMGLSFTAGPGKKAEYGAAEVRRLRGTLHAHARGHPQARDRISLAVAADALEQLQGSTDRVIRLVSLIRGAGLSPRASSYALRAARLYVWGFDAECAIMCRSALQAALVARLEEFIDQDGAAEPKLDELLKLAGEKNVLDGYETTPSGKGWRARRGSHL